MSTDFTATLDVFRRLAGADLPDWPELARTAIRRQLKAGEALFRAGEIQPFVFVVNEGVITMTYETAGGNSWVKGFVEAGMCFASLTALEPGGVTSYGAHAEAAASVEQIDHAVLLQLADRHREWQQALCQAYKVYGQRKEQREMELLTLTPPERYLQFVHRYPRLTGLVRQRDIASYVRVTPVALSRIKARLKAQGQIE